MENEDAGPLFQKSVRISRWPQQGIKLSVDPTEHRALCSCPCHTSGELVLSHDSCVGQVRG